MLEFQMLKLPSIFLSNFSRTDKKNLGVSFYVELDITNIRMTYKQTTAILKITLRRVSPDSHSALRIKNIQKSEWKKNRMKKQPRQNYNEVGGGKRQKRQGRQNASFKNGERATFATFCTRNTTGTVSVSVRVATLHHKN